MTQSEPAPSRLANYVGKVFGVLLLTYVLPQLVFKPVWPALIDAFGGPKPAFILGQFVLHLVVYIVVNSFFLLLYRGYCPFLQQYKISARVWPWEDVSPSGQRAFVNYKRNIYYAVGLWLFNNIILGIPMAYITYKYEPRGYASVEMEAFPTPWTLVWQLGVCMLVEDVLFYWSHRTLHEVKWLYSHVHKVHHRFKYTISIAAEYAHPVEWLLGNVIPFIAGPQLLGVHTATLYMWMIWRISATLEGHSGFAFPFSPFRLGGSSGKDHDLHHSLVTGNYGSSFAFWDTICGTRLDNELAVKEGLLKPSLAKKTE